MNFEIGSTVGDYQVVGILGAGGMGKVYKVRNVISDRVEAMKVLLPDLVNQPELADRFLREIKVQASLEHPNIAALHTAVRQDNQLLMLMEFVEGVSLEQKLKDGPLPPAQAADYIMQVLAALEYAHARGVVHRDIKPANMMLTPAGVVKLMDFGIARSSADAKLTQTGTTVGSLYYMSPEQIQGVAAPDARSDLYSVGVSLYELVTGKKPFDGDSQFAIMSAHLKGTPIPPVTVDPRLPQMLNDIILMSVAKYPEGRFQTAGAMRNALSSVASAPNPAPMAAPPSDDATVVLMPTQTAEALAAFQAPQATAPAPAMQAPAAAQAAEAPAPAPAAQPRRHRGQWMALGAVAAVLAIVGVIGLAPWKGKGAAPAQVLTPATQTSTPAQTLSKESPSPAAQTPPEPHVVAQQSRPASDVPARKAAGGKPASPATQAAAPPLTQQQQPALQAPIPQQTAAQPAQQQPAQQAAAPTGPGRAELQEVRESLALIGVRAEGIRTGLQSLQRSLAAGNLNLRGDVQSAANLMNTYLRGAEEALNAGDVAQARSFLDKAEPQVQKLEKFLNR